MSLTSGLAGALHRRCPVAIQLLRSASYEKLSHRNLEAVAAALSIVLEDRMHPTDALVNLYKGILSALPALISSVKGTRKDDRSAASHALLNAALSVQIEVLKLLRTRVWSLSGADTPSSCGAAEELRPPSGLLLQLASVLEERLQDDTAQCAATRVLHFYVVRTHA